MATVRIFKIAELLGTTSQEVTALLKRDHGIEVKSASSTIEEVVAREFVGRLARQRGIKVPSNASFADSPAPARGGGGKKPAGRAPEPPKRSVKLRAAARLRCQPHFGRACVCHCRAPIRAFRCRSNSASGTTDRACPMN